MGLRVVLELYLDMSMYEILIYVASRLPIQKSLWGLQEKELS